MSDMPEDIVLRYLRRIDGRLDELVAIVGEMKSRIQGLEEQMALLRADVAATYSNIVRLDHRIDRVEARLTRIENRLGLVEA